MALQQQTMVMKTVKLVQQDSSVYTRLQMTPVLQPTMILQTRTVFSLTVTGRAQTPSTLVGTSDTPVLQELTHLVLELHGAIASHAPQEVTVKEVTDRQLAQLAIFALKTPQQLEVLDTLSSILVFQEQF
jgi:hypothetical protein